MDRTYQRLIASVVILYLALPWLARAEATAGPTSQPTSAEAAHAWKMRSGPSMVQTLRFDWSDEQRHRPVPVKIYYPKDAHGPCPVIVFSHGLGGSREGYEYVGRHWASWGYVVAHPQHQGSDAEIFKPSGDPKEEARQAASEPRNWTDRPKDVSFVIDELTRLNGDKTSPLFGRMDLKHIGVAGHSFGAYTALASAGRTPANDRGGRFDLRDQRLRACIAMSAPVNAVDKTCAPYREFALPCLHMTGTEDFSPISGTTPKERRVPFDCIQKAEQYLVIFKGGNHMIFSDRQPVGQTDPPRNPVFHELILSSTTAFWDAYLRDDAKAKRWLADGGFKALLDGNGTLETKTQRP